MSTLFQKTFFLRKCQFFDMFPIKSYKNIENRLQEIT
nr:MAG TPA: hypothetical protein [Caudoviricetes sp.]